MSIEKLQSEYEKVCGKKPANRYKTDSKWLMSEIDKALEKGVEEPRKVVEPVKAVKTDKIPEDVVTLGDELMGQGLVGKFYSGAWEISIDNSGVSYKNL